MVRVYRLQEWLVTKTNSLRRMGWGLEAGVLRTAMVHEGLGSPRNTGSGSSGSGGPHARPDHESVRVEGLTENKRTLCT